MDENKDLKKNWKKMSAGQKLRYYKDYYLLLTVILLGAVCAAVFLIWHFTKPEEKDILHVAILDDRLDQPGKDALVKKLEIKFGADGKLRKVVLDDNFSSTSDGPSRLAVYMASKSIDVIISGRDTFKTYAAEGYFEDLNLHLDAPELLKWDAAVIETPGYDESADSDVTKDGTGRGDVLPYGVDLSGSSLYGSISTKLSDPVFAFAAGAPDPDNAKIFLQTLMEDGSDE